MLAKLETGIKVLHFVLLLIGVSLSPLGSKQPCFAAVSNESVEPGALGDFLELLSLPDHDRLILKVSEESSIHFKNSAKGFQLELGGLGLRDLGPQFKDGHRWKPQLAKLGNLRVHRFKLSEVPGGLRLSGQWKYPSGKNALAFPAMESFKFYDKQARQYVIDFWIKKSPTLSEYKNTQEKLKLMAWVKNNQSKSQKKYQVQSQAPEGLKTEVLRDLTYFCQQPLTSENDVPIFFLPVHEKVDFFHWFSANTPDAQYEYRKPTRRDQESQYLRLAIDLESESKYALVLRTYDFFNTEFPNSEYQSEMKLLRASSMIKLGLEAEAIPILQQLILDWKRSPKIALNSQLYMLGKVLKSNEYSQALDQFLALIEKYPSHDLNWVFHLGSAESYYHLHQAEMAAKQYRWILENAPGPKDKAQGAVRIGDLYLYRRQYEQALATYSQAQNLFKTETEEFPSFQLNWGEALYQLGQFDRAKLVFEKFLEKYSNYPAGWRASFRLAEIASRTESLPQRTVTVKHWLSETINRYPTSKGADLARMRMIPCGDHSGFDPITMEAFYKVLFSSEAEPNEILNSNFSDFRLLWYIRGLIGFRMYNKASEKALTNIGAIKDAKVREILRDSSRELCRRNIKELFDAKKNFEALAFYYSYVKKSEVELSVLDIDSILKLSLAAADLGLTRLSQEILETGIHQKGLESNRLTSEERFARAKALWILSRSSADAKIFSEIKQLLIQSQDLTEYALEREIILGLLADKEGDSSSAFQHAISAQILSPSLTVSAWAASLANNSKQDEVSIQLYRKVEDALETKGDSISNQSKPVTSEEILGVPRLPSLDQIVIAEVGLLEKAGRIAEAEDAFKRLIGKSLASDQVVYRYAKFLLKSSLQNKKEEGYKILHKLAGTLSKDSKGFWGRLAKETLDAEKGLVGI